MRESAICKAMDHLFLPILEVDEVLLRCVHCDVFAYQETVKDLAKRRCFTAENKDLVPVDVISGVGRLRRWWRASVVSQAIRWLSPDLRIQSKLR